MTHTVLVGWTDLSALWSSTDGLDKGIILGVLGVLIILWWVGRRDPRFRATAPAVMTSVGILGTFLGIFLALVPLEFEADQMNDSIQALLGGMQLAFITSLLGLGFSICFRLWDKWFPGFAEDGEEDDVESLLRAIREALVGDADSSLVTHLQKLRDENRDGIRKLDTIRAAIAGEGDSSLVTQIQKFRDENRDGSRKLDEIRSAISGEAESSLSIQIRKLREENRDGFHKLDGLSEIIRDSLVKNLETLIDDIRNVIERQLGESLRQLIAQIEEALIRQFGKTFVEFNEATQAIKRWQEDHRAHVEQITQAFDLAAAGITRIAEECRSIPVTMDALGATVETARESVALLNRHLEAVAALEEQAREAFPTIKQHLDRIGQDLAGSAAAFDGMEATLRRTFEAHGREVEAITAKLRQTLETTQHEVSENVKQTVRTSVDTLAQEVGRLSAEWGSHMVAIAEEMARVIEASREGRR